MHKNDMERAIDALYAIPANLPRHLWVKAAMGFHAAGGSFEVFDKWSAQDESYNATKTKATWKSIKTGGGVNAASLFHIAREYGYKESNQVRPQVDFSALIEKKPAAPQPPKAPTFGPALNPALIWERCIPATPKHEYIIQKQSTEAPLSGLRVMPEGDPFRQMGEIMAGALVVPVLRPDGVISSLQFITVGEVAKHLKANDKPTKLNLRGASMDGWFTVGQISPGCIVYVCEGIGTAWAAWKATGSAAVVCFGAGNMKKVAAALRQQDITTRLVVCPDVGKEDDAMSIAAAVGGAVAVMPEGWPKNSDLNDLGQSEGFDVVAWVLQNAQEPPKLETKSHPLAVFVDCEGNAKPPKWTVPGFIGHGVTVISGAQGVGKTTALLPLAMTAAGLHGDELKPVHWRHVIYVTEDIEQVKRILAGMRLDGKLGIDQEAVKERLHMVEAVRLDPAFVASVGTTYREKFTRTVNGVEILPLVVLDTKSAVLAIDNENDNSEASSMMAALKQGFDRLPVWLIGHLAKAILNNTDGLTSRGAGAIEGDANQTLFLIKDGEKRFLKQGKTRFEPKWQELEISSYTRETLEVDEFGNPETVMLRWGIAAPALTNRKEAKEQAIEAQRKVDDASLRIEIMGAASTASNLGNPLGRAALKAAIRRKHTATDTCIEQLLAEQWLVEVFVPAKERLHPRKSSFFICLTTHEHDLLLAGAGLSQERLAIPASWKKATIPVLGTIGNDCPKSEVEVQA